MTLWSKTITYLPTGTDIGGPTKFVRLDPFKLTGTGEVRSAELTLNARQGQFVTNSNGGTTPIIAAFDKIKIELTAKNTNTKSAVFLTETIRPVKSTHNIVLSLFGQERWLQKMHMPPMKIKRASHFNAIKTIIEIYNENRGTTQAEIEKHNDVAFNFAPQWTAVDFDFTDSPTYYDALMRVMNRMNTTIANGGANDFFELYFEDHPTDDTKIRIRVFSSGGLPATPVTVENTNTTKIYDINGTIEGKTGTLLIGKGDNTLGSIPSAFVKFWSRLEAYLLHPDHIPSFPYPQDAKVKIGSTHYKSNKATSETPPHADWDVITEADEIGLNPPSPYTYKKAVSLWKNSGSNPTGAFAGLGTGFDQAGCWDSNLVVRDEDHYRDWADLKSTTDNFDINYKYGGSPTGQYRTFRVLVNGTGIGAFAGHDNMLMEYNGSSWREIGPIGNNGVSPPKSGDVIAIKAENKNYIFNGSSWVDDSANDRGNDCFHQIESIQNDQGVSSVSKQKGDGTWIDLDGDSTPDTGENYGTDSAVKYTFVYTPVTVLSSSFFATPEYYQIWCGANLVLSPMPYNTHNVIGEDVGQIYGGDSTQKEPATFDMEGTFGYTPSGKRGWNHPDSDEQGPRNSINFMTRFKWEFALTGTPVSFQSNFKFRCVLYDSSGNVIFQDFTILDNDRWEQISLPLTGFKPYRARASLKFGNVLTNVILPELEVLERFEWQNAKMMCIQLQEVYDDAGRFSPEGSRFLGIESILGLQMRMSLWIDVPNFGGQLIAITPQQSDLNIEVPVERPNTTNYEQLLQDISAQKEVEEHPYDAWEIEGEALLRYDFGESIILKDSSFINDSDDGPNTKKVVVKEISISINGTDGGRGGFMERNLAVKRI